MKAEEIMKILRETLPDFEELERLATAEAVQRFGSVENAVDAIGRACFVDRAYSDNLPDLFSGPATEERKEET